MTCLDCGKEAKKVKPATVTPDGKVGYVCRECWKGWAPYMHLPTCQCPHCEWCQQILKTVQ